MSKSINILDKDHLQWVKELCLRYRNSQIKAAVKVNREVLMFYWELGRDIVERGVENRYGSKFYAVLSRDLQKELPGVSGLSERNLHYAKKFYLLYRPSLENLQQVAAKSTESIEVDGIYRQQLLKNQEDIFTLPWGHHMLLIDKSDDNLPKAIYLIWKFLRNPTYFYQRVNIRHSIFGLVTESNPFK